MNLRAAGPVVLFAASLLVGGAAAAQGFGLDLTSDAPDLRPSVAVLPVVATSERAEAALTASAAIVEVAKRSSSFARVLTPEELQERLGDGYAAALDCSEAECLTALAHQLEVERLLRSELSGDELRITGFDWGSGDTTTASANASVLKNASSAAKRMERNLEPLLRWVGRPVGTLEVATNADAAEVRWGGRLIGTGITVKSTVPAGTHPLSVTAAGYAPFESTVTVAATATTREEVTLQPMPEVPEQVAHTPVEEAVSASPTAADALWKRPGVWVATAGVLALAVGVGMGASANGVKARMVDGDGDGVLDVTRTDATGAQRHATMANVLGVAGALMMAGGGAWVFVDGSDTGTGAGAGGGVFIHGSF